MQCLAAGRHEALRELHSRYAARILRVATQSLDRDTAEDIVQDVFVAVWRKAHTFDPGRGSFRPWVFQIAHFRILNELRSRHRRTSPEPFAEGLETSLPDPSPEPEEVVQRGEERAAVRSAVEALPPLHREVVQLVDVEGFSYKDAAQTLGVPIGTVMSRLHRARQQLQKSLYDYAVESGIVHANGTREVPQE